MQEEVTLQLDIPELKDHLLQVGRELVGEQLERRTTDYFTAGMDSLRAIQMRGMIVKDLDLGGRSKVLSQNIVFETSNVRIWLSTSTNYVKATLQKSKIGRLS